MTEDDAKNLEIETKKFTEVLIDCIRQFHTENKGLSNNAFIIGISSAMLAIQPRLDDLNSLAKEELEDG